jgi:dTDP-4-amino-4,6-dideoxygalactose transaminase
VIRQLAVLGGFPLFPEGLAFARPMLPPLEAVTARLSTSYEAGILTNGALVRQLEEQVAERLGVAHVVAVSSCTAGLMLALRALVPRGQVLLPSFTFSASAHAVAWNGLTPLFAECLPETFQLDPGDAASRLDAAGAILATHVFGAPCPVGAITALAAERGLPVVFDAAHAMGALHHGRSVGSFGDAEVFSLSPTKLVVAGEGGLVATPHAEVAHAVRIGRDYGNPGDYDTRFVGLNARLSELHAALALESLGLLDEHLARRRQLAGRYCVGLAGLDGLAPQAVPDHDDSTYKDFTITLDPDAYGLGRDQLLCALAAEGVDTRRYFCPPAHRQRAYCELPMSNLPVTDSVSGSVLSLPMYGDLEPGQVDRVVELLGELHAQAEAVAAVVGGGTVIRAGAALVSGAVVASVA